MLIPRKIFLATLGLWAVVCGKAYGQSAGKTFGAEYYRSPVGFAITLAGNVGEIRSDHFHTGMDIKALQGVGSPVYATADGYVSRVGVSPTGYGNVLYVTHPNGETSVYGHLNAFAPQIARWVRAQQYAKQSFLVDLYPAKGQFPVAKGERIAFLGNTGSSGGPHLHFEIRDAQGRPRNLIAQKVFQVADRVPPVVSRILLYEVDSARGVPFRTLRQSVAVRMLPDGTAVPEDSVLRLG
ncbi:MAG: M23 family metallopeptidase, partial [Rikenellaceae bacterium]|nr:M23 family metallopeptidase [Rikenellaceae bacterium]